MKVSISENIRGFRKQRLLTQEQLAEVLGVTPGAVHKWETGMSVPELGMIIELADFFDVSVDALLGYEMKDNRMANIVARIRKAHQSHDRGYLQEAEKALKKYPHSFEIVHESAVLYMVTGITSGDKQLLNRTAELFETSKIYISQNANPKISDISIAGDIAEVYLAMGDTEKAVGILSANNPKGVFNDIIGLTLASTCNRIDDAMPVLSEALIDCTVSAVRTVFGFLNIYYKKNDFAKSREIASWAISMLNGLQNPDHTSFLSKTLCIMYTCLAYTELMLNNKDAAIAALKSAKIAATAFDENPNYKTDSIKFVSSFEASAHDDLGATATEGINNLIRSFENEELSSMWESMNTK